MSATALDALHQAHQAWIRSQPQLFFELDGLDEPPAAYPPFVSGGLVEPARLTSGACPCHPHSPDVSWSRPWDGERAAPAPGAFNINSGPTATTLDGHCAVGPQEVQV